MLSQKMHDNARGGRAVRTYFQLIPSTERFANLPGGEPPLALETSAVNDGE